MESFEQTRLGSGFFAFLITSDGLSLDVRTPVRLELQGTAPGPRWSPATPTCTVRMRCGHPRSNYRDRTDLGAWCQDSLYGDLGPADDKGQGPSQANQAAAAPSSSVPLKRELSSDPSTDRRRNDSVHRSDDRLWLVLTSVAPASGLVRQARADSRRARSMLALHRRASMGSFVSSPHLGCI